MNDGEIQLDEIINQTYKEVNIPKRTSNPEKWLRNKCEKCWNFRVKHFGIDNIDVFTQHCFKCPMFNMLVINCLENELVEREKLAELLENFFEDQKCRRELMEAAFPRLIIEEYADPDYGKSHGSNWGPEAHEIAEQTVNLEDYFKEYNAKKKIDAWQEEMKHLKSKLKAKETEK